MTRAEAFKMVDDYLTTLHSITWHLHDIGTHRSEREKAIDLYLDEAERIGLVVFEEA